MRPGITHTKKVDGLVSPENRLRGDPVAQLGPRSATPKLDASQIHILLPCVFGLHAAFMPAHSPRFAQLHGSDQEPTVIDLTKKGLPQITSNYLHVICMLHMMFILNFMTVEAGTPALHFWDSQPLA